VLHHIGSIEQYGVTSGDIMWYSLQAPCIPWTMQYKCLIAISRWGLTDVMQLYYLQDCFRLWG
jgi:hypothetical protein